MSIDLWSGKGIPVGLLFSDSSLTAAVEKTQAQATLLAIDEVNAAGGVAGRPILPVSVEIGNAPDDYRRAARYLCDQHDVRVFFGTHMSNSRKAVIPLIESRQSLLFYPTLYEGFEFSQHCVYTGAAPNQNVVPLARHLLGEHRMRAIFIGNNYVFAHESNRIMRDLFEQAGGTVLDEIYLPIGTSKEQMRTVVDEAANQLPDVIYSTVVGADTIQLYQAFASSRMRGRGIPIASLATNEVDIALMGSDAAEGHVTAAPYFETLARPQSVAFIGRYRARFGQGSPITAGAEAAYFQVHLFAAAAKDLTGQIGVDTLLEELGKVRFQAPQGEVRIDGQNHHAFLYPRIGKVDSESRFVVINEQTEAVRPEPYLIEHAVQAQHA